MFVRERNKRDINQEVFDFARDAGGGTPDPILAGSAPPGIGMTQVIEQFELAKENILKLMVAGISIEEIVSMTVFNGFMEGKFNPDVAELIKPALSLYLMKLADDVDAPFKLYAEDQPTNEIDDEELFQLMKQRNPEMYNNMLENLNQRRRMGGEQPVEQPQQMQQTPQNFLQMGDV